MGANSKNNNNKSELIDKKNCKNSIKLLRLLIDQSSDAIEVVDPKNGRFLDVNGKGCSELGYTKEEFLNLTVFDIDPTSDIDNFKNVIEKLKITGSLTWEGVHKRKDGSTFPVEVSLKLVNIGKYYLISVARDVTSRKKAEEELKKYQTHLEELVKSRTNELERKNKELESYIHLFEGREFRIKELRDKVKELEKQLSYYKSQV